MDDLISRRGAINRIDKQREHLQPDIYPQDKIGDAAYRICAEFIARLPSAQPATNCSEIPNGSDDTISRQAAIDALTHEWDGRVTSAFDVIKSLPPAQPEIVRCKDCKHYLHDEEYGFDWCNRMSGVFRAKPDGFCSWAVMRGGDSE